MDKKKKMIAAMLGIGAVGVYRAVKGKGIFNKYRFSEQHEAVARYVESHHPGALYSSLEMTSNGWSCVISDKSARYLLYITCSDDGVYIFDETMIN